MRRYWPFALVTLGVFAVSSLPYITGELLARDGRRFTGIVFDVPDTAQYFAWMRAFSHGPLIANPLTPEPGAERFANIQWSLLGLLAHHTPLGSLGSYHVLRVVALLGFAAALIWFCRIVIARHALLAFSVVMLSSGFGWTLVVAKQWTGELAHPLTVQAAEANTFFSAMAFPHLLFAAALMLAIFCLALRWDPERRLQFTVSIVGLTLLLGFSHGYDLLPTVAMPGATAAVLLIRERRIPRLAWPAALIAVAAAPGALYALGLTQLDPTWRGVLSQYGNAGVYTPAPHLLLILLGLPLLLALPQLRPKAWRGLRTPGLFVRVWLVVGFALLYIPTDFQIKMLTGYQIPVSLLAVETVMEIVAATRRRMPAARPARFAMAALLTCVVLTNIYLTAWRVFDLRRNDYPYYLSTGDVAALESLNDNVAPGEVVLASTELGLFVPVYSDARPFVAHWAQTLDYYARRDAVTWFYRSSTTDEARLQLLTEEQVTIVVAGPAEAQLVGQDVPPLLTLPVLHAGSTTVYLTDASARRQER
jgi:hypothetical protein